MHEEEKVAEPPPFEFSQHPSFQEDTWELVVSGLFWEFLHRYERAVDLVGVAPTELMRLTRKRILYRHNLYQVYLFLAGKYRREFPDWSQMELEFDGVEEEQRRRDHWLEWCRNEARNLAESSPALVRVCLQVGAMDRDDGRFWDLERRMVELLLEPHGLTWTEFRRAT